MSDEITFPVENLSHKTADIDLAGSDGNAFALAAIGKRWLQQLDKRNLSERFTSELFAGDYEELLATFDKWFETDLCGEYQFSRYDDPAEDDDDYDL